MNSEEHELACAMDKCDSACELSCGFSGLLIAIESGMHEPEKIEYVSSNEPNQTREMTEPNTDTENTQKEGGCSPTTCSAWVDPSAELPPVGEPVMGFAERWRDEDFNRKGIRDCFRTDEGPWQSAEWDNYQDQYATIFGDAPDLWQAYPDVKQNS